MRIRYECTICNTVYDTCEEANSCENRHAATSLRDAADKLISCVEIHDGKISMGSKAFCLYQTDISNFPFLQDLSEEDRQNFVIDASGSFVYWGKADAHLNLDSVRYYCDPEFKKEVDKKKEAELRSMGFGMCNARLYYGLALDACGVSEKEMDDFEMGKSMPSSTALAKIAKAHGLSLNKYLDSVAQFRKSRDQL